MFYCVLSSPVCSHDVLMNQAIRNHFQGAAVFRNGHVKSMSFSDDEALSDNDV